MALPLPAAADNVQNTLTTTPPSASVNSGASVSVGYRIQETNPSGDVKGCNVDPSYAATVTLSVPAGVTATGSPLSFTACETISNVSFTSRQVGSYVIGVAAVTGGKSGSSWNTSSATFTLNVVNVVDATPPVVTPNVAGTLGSNGWYTSDVGVSWTTSDPESAITSAACTGGNVTGDTAGQTFSCTATSAGGTTSQSVTIKRDATKPALAPAVTPNPVLQGGSATASANASDGGSGVDTQSCGAVDTSRVGTFSVNCQATDKAGNSAIASASYTVQDVTAPVIAGTVTGTKGNNDWYTSDVNVSWSVTDPESEISSRTGCDATTVSADTTGTTLTCSATSAGGTSSADVSFKRDVSPPSISGAIVGGTRVGDWYTNTSPVTVHFTCDDATSGLAGPCADVIVSTDGANQRAMPPRPTTPAITLARLSGASTSTKPIPPSPRPCVAPRGIMVGTSATSRSRSIARTRRRASPAAPAH